MGGWFSKSRPNESGGNHRLRADLEEPSEPGARGASNPTLVPFLRFGAITIPPSG